MGSDASPAGPPTALLAVALAALLAAGCGQPVWPWAGPRLGPPGPVAPPAAPAAAALEGDGALRAGGPRLRVPDLEPVPFPVPPRPWVGMRVHRTPHRPREGTAVGLRVSPPPAGRQPLSVEGSLGDREVRFGRLGAGWFGIAPVPVGAPGALQLTLRYRLGDGRTVVHRETLRVESHRYPATRLSVAPRYSRPPPEALERIRRESARVDSVLARATPEWHVRGGFRWPRPARITSPFGQRRVFNGELRSRHWGVDLAGRRGAPVRAAGRGRAVLVDRLYYAGNAVYLDHGHGVYTAYFHLSSTDVRQGEMVPRGAVLGTVGATGRVTGPHLHWSLYVDGVHLDASSLLDLEVPDAGARAGARGVPPAARLPGSGGRTNFPPTFP